MTDYLSAFDNDVEDPRPLVLRAMLRAEQMGWCQVLRAHFAASDEHMRRHDDAAVREAYLALVDRSERLFSIEEECGVGGALCLEHPALPWLVSVGAIGEAELAAARAAA